MKIKCGGCGTLTIIKQEHAYHAGFSSRGFLYCDSLPAILEFDVYDPQYVALVGDKHPWALTATEKAKVEARLRPYPRGGRFRFGALPRCPACNRTLPELLTDEIHFVEIGEVVDAERVDVWLEPSAD